MYRTRVQYCCALIVILSITIGFTQIKGTATATGVETGEGVKLDADLANTKHSSRTDDDVIRKEAEAIHLDGMSPAQVKQLRDKAEKVEFNAEVDRMMKLIINSLYKNKEIFLRELISNASDALDKIRFLSLSNSTALDATSELSIKIKADDETHMLHITDTGIGMTRQDLMNNLGTLAKSGTSDFMARVGVASPDTSDLIGQFGVGFYSAFLVADRVFVTTKHNDDIQYIWESDSSSYSIVPDPRGNSLGRGTTISLQLKEEAHEYTSTFKLKELINKYSQFINFDIFLWNTKKILVDVEEEEEATEPEEIVAEGEEEKEARDKPKRKVEKTIWDWVLINNVKPIWTKKASELTDSEYNAFYKSLTKDKQKPIGRIHFSAEGGEADFKSILYIPRSAPNDMFHDYRKDFHFIKLFVRRVFITDSLEDLVPKYLTFLRGIVDSDDLPLNVSRETLQQHRLMAVIKRKLVKKAIEMMSKLEGDDLKRFWAEYSTNIKVGIVQDSKHRGQLAKLLRFPSSHNTTHMTTLAEYIDRMAPHQEQILYVAGQSLQDVETSPFVEGPLRAGLEVLYLVEPIDEHGLMSLVQYEGRPLQSVAKEGLEMYPETEERKKKKTEVEKEFKALFDWLKNDALKDKIHNATSSDRLITSPCALVSTQRGWSGNMERVQAAEAHQRNEDIIVNFYKAMKKILELNVRHPLIKHLKLRLEKYGPEDPTSRNIARVLFETAIVRSGYSLVDVAGYADSVEKMVAEGLNLPPIEMIDDIEEDEEEAETSYSPREVNLEELVQNYEDQYGQEGDENF